MIGASRGTLERGDGLWRPLRDGGGHGTLPAHARDPAVCPGVDDGHPQPAAELRGVRASSLLQRPLQRVGVSPERRGEAAGHGASGPRRGASEVPALQRPPVAPPGWEQELLGGEGRGRHLSRGAAGRSGGMRGRVVIQHDGEDLHHHI